MASPPANNGGIKLPFRLSELLQGASSIVSVVVVLIGLVVWSARQEGRIGELEHRIKNDEDKLADLDMRGTRALAERLSVLAQGVDTLKVAHNELRVYVDTINNQGSQAGLVLAERLANDERQAVLTRERVQSFDAQILALQKLSGRLDVLEGEIKHLRPR